MFNLKTIGYTWLITCLIALTILNAPWGAVGLLSFLFIVCLMVGSFFIGLNFYLPSINKIKNDTGQVFLTFDDGPDLATPAVLDVLAKYGAKATFFCIGSQVEKHPDILLRMHEQGHLIGNHGFSHVHSFPFFFTKTMIAEIEKTNELIEKTTGTKPLYFRPPFGITNPRIAKAIKATVMTSVGWNRRSLDTTKTLEEILSRTAAPLQSGDIVLFHDRLPLAASTLEAFFKQTAGRGFRFERLDTFVAPPVQVRR
jgi:peptidoglycan/xylan/chitin deacetylase (PgdA/CDA1 family)